MHRTFNLTVTTDGDCVDFGSPIKFDITDEIISKIRVAEEFAKAQGASEIRFSADVEWPLEDDADDVRFGCSQVDCSELALDFAMTSGDFIQLRAVGLLRNTEFSVMSGAITAREIFG